MNCKIIFTILVGLILLSFSEGQAQTRNVRLLLNQHSLQVGGVDYEVMATGLFGGDKLRAPNGSRLELSNRYQIGGLTFAQFQADFVGNWTIENNVAGSTQNHFFDVDALLGLVDR